MAKNNSKLKKAHGTKRRKVEEEIKIKKKKQQIVAFFSAEKAGKSVM